MNQLRFFGRVPSPHQKFTGQRMTLSSQLAISRERNSGSALNVLRQTTFNRRV